MSRLQTRGEGNASHRLKKEQVKFIKLAYYYGASQLILSLHFKTSVAHIYRITHNLDWKWL
jgi:hypothetical protein